MKLRDPIARLPTHEVANMPPHMGDQDLWADDEPLRFWTATLGGSVHARHLADAGRRIGRDEVFEKANQANRHGPELRAFDRHGMRIDTVEYHPAYHDLMELAISGNVHNFAWHHEGNAGQLGQAVLSYMFSQPEGGVMCPVAMTYSVVPSLRATPAIERNGCRASCPPTTTAATFPRRRSPAPRSACS